MKYILIALIIIFLSNNVYSQDTTFRWAANDTATLTGGTTIEWQDTEILADSASFHWSNEFFKLITSELFISVSPEADTLKSSIYIVGDTMAAFRLFYQSYLKLQEKSNAAEEILKYININGTVSDRIKFNAAVEKYQRIKQD